MSYVRLEAANGPECPHCGCRDARILREPNPDQEGWWAGGKARCKNCGRVFAFRKVPRREFSELEPEPVPPDVEAEPTMEPETESMAMPLSAENRDTAYPVRACPECESPDVLVKSSPRAKPGDPKLRYHICKACHATFKSIDSRKTRQTD